MLKSYTSVLGGKTQESSCVKTIEFEKKKLVYVLKALNKGRYILRRLYKLNFANYLIQWGFLLILFQLIHTCTLIDLIKNLLLQKQETIWTKLLYSLYC